jgi:NTP pyrophosphatase (non-canonical NTP hydrolase)
MLNKLLNNIGDEIHANKISKGWKITTMDDWENPSEILSVLMLINTELAEAAEAVRHDDIENFKEELADVMIRTIGLAHGMGIRLGDAIEVKMRKNRKREYHHGGKRI